MSRRLTHLIGATMAFAIGLGCDRGSSLELRVVTYTPDATTPSDTTTAGDLGPLSLEPSADFGLGAVTATSSRYRMVSTLGPSFGTPAPSESPRYQAPVESR